MTVGRLRLLVGRTGRRLGPALVIVIAVASAGLGVHAALDWHRHGDPGAGFFHLHVHFGAHEHPDHQAAPADEKPSRRAAIHPVGHAGSGHGRDEPSNRRHGVHDGHDHDGAGHHHHDDAAPTGAHRHDHADGGDDRHEAGHARACDRPRDAHSHEGGTGGTRDAAGFPESNDPVPPGSEPPGERHHAGVLTLALGVAPAPSAPTLSDPTLESGEHAPVAAGRLADRPSERCAWSPRGPPA